MPNFIEQPGYLFVVATLLPLISFLIILLHSGLWCLGRLYKDNSAAMESLYKMTGGDSPTRLPAFIALGAIALAFLCCISGFILFEVDQHQYLSGIHKAEGELAHLKGEKLAAMDPAEKKSLTEQIESKEKTVHELEHAWEVRRKGSHEGEKHIPAAWKATLFELVHLRPLLISDPSRSTTLNIGFSIDSLSGLMFVMVTFIATLIHLFSMGYMSEEQAVTVEDHHVHGEDGGHFHRRGRFGRFFMYLSLFCFSMLNLILADNLFQVFVSWELVGICSYLLIGFYFERQSASNASNKAFITNRIGDAGFIIGLLILWSYMGTLDFESMFNQVRHPMEDAHHHAGVFAGKIVRAELSEDQDAANGGTVVTVSKPGEAGSQVILFPREPILHEENKAREKEVAKLTKEREELSKQAKSPANLRRIALLERAIEAKEGHFDNYKGGRSKSVYSDPMPEEAGFMPYWMLVAAGLGVFLGCVGKSAQFPLQVWLPDAMEGPTPVSALIHAATMVAAGVYLVGRCYPIFTPEVLLVIAYTGAITLFVAATIAIVATDIKKVLAYSTVSQLGYMMLALGVGGWVAGLFHLVTHAFFKALLFLGSGSVIYGCHHEQEMTKMGGLYPKMRITALTMLMGVLAIAGIPLFSGWYSKDSIVAQALGYVTVHPHHALLFLLPLLTAGITTFYMFRMWFMTFTGEPRDHHVYEHAHESPWLMTVPLIILAFFSVTVAWGWPVWDATQSQLEHRILQAQHVSVMADFGHVYGHGEGGHAEHFPSEAAKPAHLSERHQAHEQHNMAGFLALGMVGLGLVFALVTYFYRALDPGEAKEQFPQVYALLVNKWYFDEIYSVLLVRPAMIVARFFQRIDLVGIDGIIHGVAGMTLWASRISGKFDTGFVDWLVNLIASVTYGIGNRLRSVQTGSLRSYVLFLVLAAIGIFVALSYFVTMATAG